MTKPTLTSCCICASLRTGSLIIGYLKAIGSILIIILGITLLSRQNSYRHDRVVSGAAFVVTAGVNLIFAGFLIAGALEGNPRHLQKYIIFTYMTWALAALSLALYPANGLDLIPTFVFEIYFVIVVRSHKQELEFSPPACNVELQV